MNEIFELPLDTTGELSSNKVSGEIHTLANQKIRAISPLKGVFFSDSMALIDTETGRELKPRLDYILTEHYHSLSRFYGKDIAGMVVITNPAVGDEVSIGYQALGQLYNVENAPLREFLDEKLKTSDNSGLLWDVYNNQSRFIPSEDHIDIGDQIGFEYLLYAMEKVRTAVELSEFDVVTSLTQDIDSYLTGLTNTMDLKLRDKYLPIAQEFIKQFNVTKLRLEKVANLAPATTEEARELGDENYSFASRTNKYITLKGITALKEEIYNRLVSKKQTNLGVHYGVIALPLLSTLETLTNGGTVIVDAYDNYSLGNSNNLNSSVYPDLSKTSDRWSITKIINNADNRGGVLLGINLNTSETYIGILRIVETPTPTLIWRKQLTEYDIENVIDLLSKHFDDKNNPHKVNKEQVALGNVENLPPVTRADIAARKPVRKYITFDAFLLFMKTYMTCIKTVEDLPDANCESDVIRNIKLIFAPCGPCGSCCTPNKPVDATDAPVNLPTVDPFDTLYGWYCQGNAKIGIYADGLGGTTTRQVEANSADCSDDDGSSTPAPTPAPTPSISPA